MDRDDRVEKWEKDGLMTPSSILSRINGEMDDVCLSSDDHQTLRETFNIISFENEGIKCVDREAFIALLARTAHISIVDLFEAGVILFDGLVYLSRTPFKAGAGTLLTLDGLARALVWVLLERSNRWFEAGTGTRARTAADQRRILFQSLATEDGGKFLPFNEQEANENARRKAFDLPQRMLDFAVTNYDGDGDEMYHDVLDVLYNTQLADRFGPYAPVRRDDFRALASSLHDRRVCLRHLAIPRSRFLSLVALALSITFDLSSDGIRSPKDFTSAAESVVNAFDRKNSVGVTWEMFDEAFTRVAPQLFNPIHRLLSTLLTHDKNSSGTTIPELPPSFGTILTPPHLSQLATFLSETLCFHFLRLASHYTPSTRPTEISDLLQFIQASRDPILLLIAGKSTSDGERHVYGAWIPFPDHDGTAIKAQEAEHWQRCATFQLSPMQDVFHGCVGNPAWHVTGSGACFGNETKGVAMDLSEGLCGLKVAHRIAGGEEVYRATKWRGDWSVDIEVEELEVWTEVCP